MKKAALAAHLADEKKAENIQLIDVRGICNFADMFLVCTGNNRIHINAINDSIADGLRQLGMKYPKENAELTTTWVVLDAGDVVAHVMTQESRDFYRLEKLWGDGKPVDWEQILADNPDLAKSIK